MMTLTMVMMEDKVSMAFESPPGLVTKDAGDYDVGM